MLKFISESAKAACCLNTSNKVVGYHKKSPHMPASFGNVLLAKYV